MEIEVNLQTDAPFKISLNANLPAGANIRSLHSQGKNWSHETKPHPWGTVISATFPVRVGRSQIGIDHSGGIQFLIEPSALSLHGVSKDLRLLRWHLDGHIYQVDLEGVSDHSYKMNWFTSRKLRHAEGVRILGTQGNQIQSEIIFPTKPETNSGRYIAKTIKFSWEP